MANRRVATPNHPPNNNRKVNAPVKLSANNRPSLFTPQTKKNYLNSRFEADYYENMRKMLNQLRFGRMSFY